MQSIGVASNLVIKNPDNPTIVNNGIHLAKSISRLENDILTSFKRKVPDSDIALRNVSDDFTIQRAKVYKSNIDDLINFLRKPY